MNMYIIKVRNLLSGKEYKGQFSNEVEALSWLEKRKEKNSFGKAARQAIKGQDEYDASLVYE